MKRLTKNFVFSLFVAIIFFLPMQTVAQTVFGDFSGLKKQAFANIKVNYTDASIQQVEGKGGTFGSAINLIGDGAKSTGKNIAKIISNKFSKIKLL